MAESIEVWWDASEKEGGEWKGSVFEILQNEKHR